MQAFEIYLGLHAYPQLVLRNIALKISSTFLYDYSDEDEDEDEDEEEDETPKSRFSASYSSFSRDKNRHF